MQQMTKTVRVPDYVAIGLLLAFVWFIGIFIHLNHPENEIRNVFLTVWYGMATILSFIIINEYKGWYKFEIGDHGK